MLNLCTSNKHKNNDRPSWAKISTTVQHKKAEEIHICRTSHKGLNTKSNTIHKGKLHISCTAFVMLYFNKFHSTSNHDRTFNKRAVMSIELLNTCSKMSSSTYYNLHIKKATASTKDNLHIKKATTST